MFKLQLVKLAVLLFGGLSLKNAPLREKWTATLSYTSA